MDSKDTIAYFTMEIGLEEAMRTYAGGLGVLAGDTARAAADLEIPMIVVTLLYRQGYFRQRIDTVGTQIEEPAAWPVAELLQKVEPHCEVEIEGRTVELSAWTCDVKGVNGYRVPVYFLDSSLEKNSAQDRALTDYLYGGDGRYQLCPGIILGIGGGRGHRGLRFHDIKRIHTK